MITLSPYDVELVDLLRSELRLSEGAVLKPESSVGVHPIRFDLVIEDDRKMFVIEIKRIVRLEDLSRIGLLKHLLAADPVDTGSVEFVIAGKRVTNEAASAAEKIGIRIIRLPASAGNKEQEAKQGIASVKITGAQSWQVISHLLMLNPVSSIRQLAMASGVSYGWAHATVKSLMEKGIVSDMDGTITISDINKLLNGIAWERPFERLFFREFRIAAENHIELAIEISLVCMENQIPCAFTSFTAGEMYTQYSARHDSLYLYIEKGRGRDLVGMFDTCTEGGIAVRLYAPDRDVFRDCRIHTIPTVPIVSPGQALLDCAGLGYGGRDLTLKMVGILGAI